MRPPPLTPSLLCRSLDLNILTEVSVGLLQGATALTSLSLGQNYIATIAETAFASQAQLQTL